MDLTRLPVRDQVLDLVNHRDQGVHQANSLVANNNSNLVVPQASNLEGSQGLVVHQANNLVGNNTDKVHQVSNLEGSMC